MNKIEDKKIEDLDRQIANFSVADFHHLGTIEGRFEKIREEYDRLNKGREVELKPERRLDPLHIEWLFSLYDIPKNATLRDSKLKRFSKKRSDVTEELIDELGDEWDRLEVTKLVILKKIRKGRPNYRKLCCELMEIYTKSVK